ncbi:MBL fold metallo-hydrolase [Pseudenhygromyxa sp. WMMC2535]|uniref:lipase family protein n=1 Tax=Pseudenhygromyxa sp. WMMC2535 TaxID=2712867 RepID=UPI0015533859|nr:MBL fold metallo-hydrolase [Pseudenhygromyxa sp. WMMC2535]NVB40695.1 MBL fold metallo-hydrolase [Pseudenhygromyxa sp. WMMC2535]
MQIKLKYHDFSFIEYEINGTTVFIDPCFSRYDKGDWVENEPVRPCDIVAVTSGDFDHYLDTLDVMEDSAALMLGSKRMCKAVADKLDLPSQRFVALDDGEAAKGPDFRIEGYQVFPDRFRDMAKDFSRRPFDLPKFMINYYKGRPNDPGRAYVIEIGERRLIHLGSALNEKVKWKDVRAIDEQSVDPILVVGCLLENTDTIIRAIRIFDPSEVYLYLPREVFYQRLDLDRDSIEECARKIKYAVGDKVEIVCLGLGTTETIDMSPRERKQITWSMRQQMVTLSLLSYVGVASIKGNPKRLSELIQGFLDKYEGVMGDWKFVWGPGVSQSMFADEHVFFVVQNTKRPNEVTIVIRGTNPLALENVIVEVNGFMEQVDWAYGKPGEDEGTPRIAKGVQVGISALLNLVPDEGLPGAGLTILQYLKRIEDASPEPVHVIVTGHSLGGTLSSTLALLLQNALEDEEVAKKIDLRLDKRSKVSCYPIAGFSAGNPDFAMYSDKRLENTDRIWNDLDAVPFMYSAQDLAQVPRLFEPEIDSMVMKVGVNSTIQKLSDANLVYEQIMRHQEAIPGSVSTTSSGFIAEMLWQHTEGYIEALDLEDYVHLLELLNAK